MATDARRAPVAAEIRARTQKCSGAPPTKVHAIDKCYSVPLFPFETMHTNTLRRRDLTCIDWS